MKTTLPSAVLVVLWCVFSSCSSSSNYSSLSRTEKICSTFAVLPFFSPNPYPYVTDFARESFLNAFAARGMDRSYADDQWEAIDTLFASLVNVSEEQADTIAKLLGVDLLITGELRNKGKTRVTMYSARVIPQSLLIKAYHAKSQKFILHKAPNDIEYWGLSVVVKDYPHHAKDFVDDLVHLGYVY